MSDSSILVLEDDENLLELIIDILESKGYSVEGASGAEEALSLDAERREAKEPPFWLVISDVRMAGSKDGVEVLTQLKSQSPQMRCIVMTGFADQSAPLRALRIRVDDYLYKPFELAELLATIERLKDGPKLPGLLDKLKKWWGKRQTDQYFPAAQKFRETCLHDFWLGIRSKALYHETALSIWDELEQLELRFMQCLESPDEVPFATWKELTAAYASWQSKIAQRATDKSLVLSQKRSEALVSKPAFRAFFDNIQNGKLVSQELVQAAYARALTPEQREAEEALYTKFWGSWR